MAAVAAGFGLGGAGPLFENGQVGHLAGIAAQGAGDDRRAAGKQDILVGVLEGDMFDLVRQRCGDFIRRLCLFD
jgi:hypothetical protein